MCGKTAPRSPKGIKRHLGWFLMELANKRTTPGISRAAWNFYDELWSFGFRLYYRKAAD